MLTLCFGWRAIFAMAIVAAGVSRAKLVDKKGAAAEVEGFFNSLCPGMTVALWYKDDSEV